MPEPHLAQIHWLAAVPGTSPDALVLSAREGNPAAWLWLHATYSPRVLRWCRALGGRIDAEDATQEVFIRLSRLFHRFKAPEDVATAFESWLYGITRRVVSEHRRRVWWQRWMGEIAPTRAAIGPTPEADAVTSETTAAVLAVLQDLSKAHREVLVLCLMEGRTSAEAAALSGVPAPTVRRRLTAAKQRFAAAARRRGLEV